MQERNDPFRTDNMVALVTGGGSGIGLAIAEALCRSGAQTVICGRRMDVLASAVERIGERAIAERYDVTQTDQAPEFVERVLRRVGTIDILVNNAGIHLKKPADVTDEAEFLNVLNTHVIGAHALTRAVLPSMRAKKNGRILFIASMTALFGMPQVIAYSAAKSAYLGMVMTLATEVGGDGITVNAIAPGFIDTPMMRKAVESDPDRKDRILKRTSLRRFGTPDDIGLAAVYLSSPAASFITGTCLVVDGGAANGF